MTVTDELLEAAGRYEASFDKGDLPLPPGRAIAIVACSILVLWGLRRSAMR